MSEKSTGVVVAVCKSEKKGTEKKPTESGSFQEHYGLVGDAHAGNWHRQVSLLSVEKVEEFRARGGEAAYGAFGENILVRGMDLAKLLVGTRLRCGDVLLRVTQIGKECHNHCAIYQRVGDCIMPREGIFAEVLCGGTIQPGDEITEEGIPEDEPFTAAVITLSDKGFRGEREDKSGPCAAQMLAEAGYRVEEQLLLPDEKEPLVQALSRLCDQRQISLIVTSGGTGFSVRDVTPEATLAVAERNAPGIAEAIRAFSMQVTGRAMLSRGVSVIRGHSVIVNLPGSPKAVEESLGFVLKDLKHGLEILRGSASECGRQ